MKNLKKCDGCQKPKVIWRVITEESGRKRYCQSCWSCHSSGKSSAKKPKSGQKKLRPRSLKRQEEEKEYSVLRKQFLQDHPMCQMHIIGICTGHSTDVHHTKGRAGELYLDTQWWKAACRACHSWAETHPKEARELGFSETKL